jgi:hypothetical protein
MNKLFSLLFFLLLLCTETYKAQFCNDCKIIGEDKFTISFVSLNPKNIHKLIPKYNGYSDTVFFELRKIAADSHSVLDGIYVYQFRYKNQKSLRYTNSTGTYSIYYSFIVENNKIKQLWNLTEFQRKKYFERKYDLFISKYGAEYIDNLIKDSKFYF